jgi:hypothetical protein
MPNVNDMHPSNYLKASDLDDEDLTLTMKAVKQESIGQGAQAEEKWILYFKGQDKGLVLNKTNTTTIAKLYGDDTDGWLGKRITLFATQVDFQGRQVDAIRVKNKAPKEAARPEKAPAGVTAEDESDEDIPF